MTDQKANASLASRLVKPLLKAGFVFVLFYFLVQRGFISLEATKRAFTRLDLIVPAVLLLFSTSLLGAIRWQWLLRAQGIHIRWKRVIELAYIGNFFNIALPGAVSGDFVKAFYVAREVQGHRARAFGSILFDRVAGLSALVLVSAGSLVLGLHSFQGTGLFPAIRLLLIAAAVGVFVFYTYLFLVREKHDPLLRALVAIERKVPKAGSVTRIYEGIRHYHHHRWVVLKVLLISVVIHLFVSYACLKFIAALGDEFVQMLSTSVVVPLGLLVTAVPVAPAGVGTGHAAFSWLFRLLGSQRGADVFSLFALTQLLIGAVGGIVYLRFRTHEPKPTA